MYVILRDALNFFDFLNIDVTIFELILCFHDAPADIIWQNGTIPYCSIPLF